LGVKDQHQYYADIQFASISYIYTIQLPDKIMNFLFVYVSLSEIGIDCIYANGTRANIPPFFNESPPPLVRYSGGGGVGVSGVGVSSLQLVF